MTNEYVLVFPTILRIFPYKNRHYHTFVIFLPQRVHWITKDKTVTKNIGMGLRDSAILYVAKQLIGCCW